MKLLKVGSKGVNIANIASWETSRVEELTGDATLVTSSEHYYEVITLTYIGGNTDRFSREEATALRQWLEANAEDATKPLPRANRSTRRSIHS
jgi:hypothetical protein